MVLRAVTSGAYSVIGIQTSKQNKTRQDKLITCVQKEHAYLPGMLNIIATFFTILLHIILVCVMNHVQ